MADSSSFSHSTRMRQFPTSSDTEHGFNHAEMDQVIENDPGYTEERFRVDRRKLEQMLQGSEAENEQAEDFFQKVMEETQTLITWPSKLKIGAKSKKDPHIKVSGQKEAVKSAKERILSILDTKSNRVTLKMDVSHTDHSHVIGKGGNNIKRVMTETGCHIHFPDSNRSGTQLDKSNQVSIAGQPEGVELARAKIRDLLPLVFMFEIPIASVLQHPLEVSSPLIQQIQNAFSVSISFKQRPRAYTSTIIIRGSVMNHKAVKEATILLIENLTGNIGASVPVSMQLEIAPQHHLFMMGRQGVNVKQMMQRTGATIHFPDPATAPPQRRGTVFITGTIDAVILARHQLIGCLPLVLMFDMKDEADFDQGESTQLMEQLDVFISIKPKPKQPSKSVIVKSIERNAQNMYEARARLLGTTSDTMPYSKPVVDGLSVSNASTVLLNSTNNLGLVSMLNPGLLSVNTGPSLLMFNGTTASPLQSPQATPSSPIVSPSPGLYTRNQLVLMPSAKFTLPPTYTLPSHPTASHIVTSTAPPVHATTESPSLPSQPPTVDINVPASQPEILSLPATASTDNNAFSSRMLEANSLPTSVSIDHSALPTSVSHIAPPPGIYRFPTPAERTLPTGPTLADVGPSSMRDSFQENHSPTRTPQSVSPHDLLNQPTKLHSPPTTKAEALMRQTLASVYANTVQQPGNSTSQLLGMSLSDQDCLPHLLDPRSSFLDMPSPVHPMTSLGPSMMSHPELSHQASMVMDGMPLASHPTVNLPGLNSHLQTASLTTGSPLGGQHFKSASPPGGSDRRTVSPLGGSHRTDSPLGGSNMTTGSHLGGSAHHCSCAPLGGSSSFNGTNSPHDSSPLSGNHPAGLGGLGMPSSPKRQLRLGEDRDTRFRSNDCRSSESGCDSDGSIGSDHLAPGGSRRSSVDRRPSMEETTNAASSLFPTSPSLFAPFDYEKKKLLATKAMQQKPDGASRIPTDYWSGMGFSKSMPDAAIRERLRHLNMRRGNGICAPPYQPQVPEEDELDSDPWKDSTEVNSNPHISAAPGEFPSQRSKIGDFDPGSGNHLDGSGSRSNSVYSHKPDLAELFSNMSLEKYTDLFQQQEIDMGTFVTLSDQDLKELGITKFGARRKMLLAIADLNKRQTPLSVAPGSNNPFRTSSSAAALPMSRRHDMVSQSGRW